MENDKDIYGLANYCLNLAEKKSSNLKCAEVFFATNNYINIEIEENSIKNSEIGSDFGSSIRVINKVGSLGFAYTNFLDKKSIENMVKKAITMMNVGTTDLDFKNLPHRYETYPKINGLFDSNIKNLQIEDSIKYTEDLIKVCSEDELAISQSANFLSNCSERYIFNSNGLEIEGKETVCSISSNIIVKDKVSKETSFGYEWQSKRNLNEINATEIAKNALLDAKLNLNRIKIKSKKTPLILTPKGTINLILSPLASAVNAETYQYKRSFLIDKKDKIIGSEHLNVEDDALIERSTGSLEFDGEGVPCKNKKIVESGKFVQLLYNSYTAGKDGVESTGNASRSSYSSVPSIGISNFIMKSGDLSKVEMISTTKEGILFDYTGDSPNIATGDFSGLILHGNIVKNGEIKESLNETMIGINLLDLFKSIEAVSKDFSVYGSYKAPYVKIKDVQIIGSAN